MSYINKQTVAAFVLGAILIALGYQAYIVYRINQKADAGVAAYNFIAQQLQAQKSTQAAAPAATK